jgi:hypothetical protein
MRESFGNYSATGFTVPAGDPFASGWALKGGGTPIL